MNFMINFNKTYVTKYITNLFKYSSCRQLSSNIDPKDVIDEEVIKNERLFVDLNIKQFECLVKNNNQMKKIESILNNYEYQKYTTLEVPTTLTIKHMSFLLELKSSDERNKFLSKLYRNEIKILINKRLKENAKSLKRQELDEKWKNSKAERTGIFDKNGDIVYGLWHNTLFTRISPQYVRRYTVHKLRTAALFGQNIVFDLTCGPSMKPLECQSKLDQLMRCYSMNRNRFKEPFNLNFCNYDKNSILCEAIQRNYEKYSHFPYFLSDFTEKSYLDLFERKSLVYLTPNAKKPLDFDPNKVYIISLSDGCHPHNYNSILGRKENIELRRLPIEEHVFWTGHTKDLKSHFVLNILNDVREGLKWGEAIERNVPKDFIKSKERVLKEEMNLSDKYKKQMKASIDLKELFE